MCTAPAVDGRQLLSVTGEENDGNRNVAIPTALGHYKFRGLHLHNMSSVYHTAPVEKSQAPSEHRPGEDTGGNDNNATAGSSPGIGAY